jgi:hypothetical protein
MSKKRLPFRPPSLPDASEKALLHVLVDRVDLGLKFKNICDRQPEVFGTPASALRRKVQKRRDYLIANPDVFQCAVQAIVAQKDSYPTEEPEPQPSFLSSIECPILSPSPSRVIVPKSSRSASRVQKPAIITPFSPPLPRNIMAHLQAAADGPSYQLHIEKFWKNPNGMLAIKGNEVVEDNTVMDKLTIMKPIYDMDDFDNKLYKARLTDEGDGLIVTEPTIPGYLWKNPAEIQALVDLDNDDGVCQKTELTYKTIRMDMKKNRDYKTHEVTYFFPKGTTCNNEHFNRANRRSSQYELNTDMYVYELQIGEDQEGRDIVQYCPFIVWRMAIDGEGKQTEDDDDGVRGAEKALARLGIKVGTKKKTNDSSMDD